MNFSPLIKRMLFSVYIPLGWTIVIIILLCIPGSMLPKEEGFKIPQFDKFVHMILFGGFVYLWCFFSLKNSSSIKTLLRKFFFIFCLAIALGIALEFVQKYWIPFRDFDEADIIADMIGASIAYGYCNIFLSANTLN